MRRATRRKVEFEIITKDDNEYIHELSHHDGPNFLNRHSRTNSPTKRHKVRQSSEVDIMSPFSPHPNGSNATQRISKRPPKIPEPTAFSFPPKAKSNPEIYTNSASKKSVRSKYSHSENIFARFSGILQRENSVKRDELVIKKPNALSMDVGKLDTAHHEFEYSDHEDSHFYSDIGRYEHDIISVGTSRFVLSGASSKLECFLVAESCLQ